MILLSYHAVLGIDIVAYRPLAVHPFSGAFLFYVNLLAGYRLICTDIGEAVNSCIQIRFDIYSNQTDYGTAGGAQELRVRQGGQPLEPDLGNASVGKRELWEKRRPRTRVRGLSCTRGWDNDSIKTGERGHSITRDEGCCR